MTKGCVHNAVFFALSSLGTTNKSVFLDIIWAEMVKNVQHVQLTWKLWVIEHKIISIHNYISLCVRSSIFRLIFCIYKWFQILFTLINPIELQWHYTRLYDTDPSASSLASNSTAFAWGGAATLGGSWSLIILSGRPS